MSRAFDSYRLAQEARRQARLDIVADAIDDEAARAEAERVEEPGNGSDRRGSGPEALFFASIEQKLLDCKALVGLGIIVNGNCIREWPRDAKGKPKVFLGEYENTSGVHDLLRWAYGEGDRGLAGCLDYLGSDLNADDLLAKVGMPRRGARAA